MEGVLFLIAWKNPIVVMGDFNLGLQIFLSIQLDTTVSLY